jgi:hypothetical protein
MLNGKLTEEKGDVKVSGVTSDNRIGELVELVNEFQKTRDRVADLDVIVQTIGSGSNEYIKWVKEVTESKA